MDRKHCCPAASAYELCKMLQISEEVRHNRTECTECLVPYCYTRHQTMHLHHYHRPSLILTEEECNHRNSCTTSPLPGASSVLTRLRGFPGCCLGRGNRSKLSPHLIQLLPTAHHHACRADTGILMLFSFYFEFKESFSGSTSLKSLRLRKLLD